MADDAAEIPAFEIPVLVGEHVGFRVTEGRLRLVPDAAVAAHPAEDTSLATLAGRAGLSPRHFARLFRQEIGMTPAAWVETVRIDAARQMLETGERPEQAAAACGFTDIDTFRRAFQRQAGVTPAEYRRRYELAEAA
jgi:transcriptional regulator GlxA family with amidase domain